MIMFVQSSCLATALYLQLNYHLSKESCMKKADQSEFFQTAEQVTVDTRALDKLFQTADLLWKKYEKTKNVAEERLDRYKRAEKDLVKTLNAIGKSKYFVEGMGTFSVRTRYSYTTPKSMAEKRALVDYITKKYGKDTAFGMLSINSNTLNAWTKQENEASPGISIPGLASPTATESLVFPRAGEAIKQGAGNGNE